MWPGKNQSDKGGYGPGRNGPWGELETRAAPSQPVQASVQSPGVAWCSMNGLMTVGIQRMERIPSSHRKPRPEPWGLKKVHEGGGPVVSHRDHRTVNFSGTQVLIVQLRENKELISMKRQNQPE